MTPALRTTRTLLCAALLLVFAGLLGGACAASEAEVKRAKQSGYDTDFAKVYSVAMEEVVRLYPRSTENPRTGVIKTAWHVVRVQTRSSGRNSSQSSQANQVQGVQGNAIQGLTTTARSDYRRFFVRFRVYVGGGKPWRIRIEGEASEWRAGQTPMPLVGAEVPPWLDGRVNALYVAIHDRLKKHAVRIKSRDNEVQMPVVDTSVEGLPEEIKEVVESVNAALLTRDMSKLRGLMADDILWSDGELGNADVALAMWQADPAALDELEKVINSGCTLGEGALNASCPAAYATEPSFEGYRLILEKRGGQWVLVAFYSK